MLYIHHKFGVMYDMPHFKSASRKEVVQFIQRYPFALVVSKGEDMAATQVPLLLEQREEKLYLQGHMMRHTDHYRAFLENNRVLVVFSGPNAYVSASWYQQPTQGSTWNYMSVHCKGKMRLMEEQEFISMMKKFTLHFEENNADSPTIFDNLPEDYTNQMMPHITGFEIEVIEMNHVFKLSQNRDLVSYNNIIHHLEKRAGMSALVAEEMRKIKK
jgi:transcriptional regulator